MDKSRRKFLKEAAAGGVILSLGALSGFGGFKAGQTLTAAEYELEIAKLRTLLKLYQELDKIGLDALLKTALKAIKMPLEAVKEGVKALEEAIGKAEEALAKFLAFLARWREILKEGEKVLLALGSGMEEAGKLMSGAIGKILPFAEAVVEFFAQLLRKLPFGVGKELGEALESIKNLLRELPEIVEKISSGLINNMKEDIAPQGNGKAKVEEEFSEPIKIGLLEPLKRFLVDVNSLVESFEKDFSSPIEEALAKREEIRQQIEEFRRQHNI